MRTGPRAGTAGRVRALAERQSEISLDALIGLLLVPCGQRPSAVPIHPAVPSLEGWMRGLDPTPLGGYATAPRPGPYQLPTFGIVVHGSCGGSASPCCRSSIEIPLGDLMNAMRPSRGGRLMVTPLSISCLQVL